MTPHLLYIAFWYPPSRASGVYRALATTRVFAASGWDVTIITCDRPFLEDEVGSIDESLLEEIPPGVKVIRVPFTFGLGATLDVRSLNWWKANLPSAWHILRQRTGGSGEMLADKYETWIDPVLQEGIAIDSDRRVDHILATGNPYSSFEAARLLGDDIATSFSVDYRDPWTIDVFSGTTEHADRRTLASEEQIVEQADFCFQVNDAIADAYRELYPNHDHKQVVVHNGYDAESIPPQSGPASSPYRFGILGTMNDRWPTDAIFKAWNSSLPELPEGSELVLAGHLGYFGRSKDVLEAYLPDEGKGFRYIGPVRKAEVADFYDSIDVVILPVPGGPMVTSGKVFETIALGKPIVCVQTTGGGARLLLEDHPLAVTAEPTPESVQPALLEAARMAGDLDPDIVATVRSTYTGYERHVAMRPMVDAITGTLRTGDRA